MNRLTNVAALRLISTLTICERATNVQDKRRTRRDELDVAS